MANDPISYARTTQVRLRRGTTAQIAANPPIEAEPFYDLTENRIGVGGTTEIIEQWKSQFLEHTADATDAVAMNMQEKLDETISAENFGAVGDGVTDDSGAIQKAVDHLAGLGGGTVLLTGGKIYAVNNPIILKNRVGISSNNRSLAVIQQIGTAAEWESKSGDGVICTLSSSTYDRVYVKNIRLAGIYTTAIPSGSANYARAGIFLVNCQNSEVENCSTSDTSSGIAFSGSISGVTHYNNKIINCRAYRARSWSQLGNPGTPRGLLIAQDGCEVNDSYSLESSTGIYASTSNSSINNNVAKDWSYDDGYYIIGDNNRVNGNIAVGDDFGSGFAIAYSLRSVVNDNIAVSCGNMGFRIHAPQSYTTITGNLAYACGYGFRVDVSGQTYPADVSYGVTMTGNVAVNSGLCGFQLQWINGWTIGNNISVNNNQNGVTLSTRGGISLYAYCVNSRLYGNQCYDTQGVPTQTFGLYSYLAVDSGSVTENTGNIIEHKSVNGTDQFYFNCLSGNKSAVVATGTRSVGGTVTFSGIGFDSIPKVALAVTSASAVADAERPISVSLYSVSATGFSFLVDLHANALADRTVTFDWLAKL